MNYIQDFLEIIIHTPKEINIINIITDNCNYNFIINNNIEMLENFLNNYGLLIFKKVKIIADKIIFII